MKTVNVIQGTPEWHAHRATHFNASDAPAMMGVSPYETRSQLMHRLHTGIAPEVDAGTQRRFDNGHRFEELARPLAVAIIGQELYPVTGVHGLYSASFDGLTMDDSVAFEHKTINIDIKDSFDNGGDGQDLPMRYRVQMEQQLMVSGANKTLFMATKWDSDTLIEVLHCWYKPDMGLRGEIVAGWAQFNRDRAEYVPAQMAEPVVAKTVSALPVVFDMRVEGKLVSCNIDHYKPAALAYIASINSELVTDQHFADADKDAKYCRESAKKLGLAIEQALGQMGDINEAIGIVREIAASFDAKGLMLEKLVKSEKEARKLAIVSAGRDAFAVHISALNTRLGKPYMPTIAADFAGVTKGLKTVASMENAVNTELARGKIEANAVADKIQANMGTLAELAIDYKFLFGDTATIVLKANDDLTALVKTRIAEHQANEAAKEEATRQRIRAEEQAKAESEARAKIAAEKVQMDEAARKAEQDKAFELLASINNSLTVAKDNDLLSPDLIADITDTVGSMAAEIVLANASISSKTLPVADVAQQSTVTQAQNSQRKIVTLADVHAALDNVAESHYGAILQFLAWHGA